MLDPINAAKNWFNTIPPEGKTVKICALIPVVNTIFLMVKERQLMQGFYDNQISKSTKAQKYLKDLSKLTSTLYNWGNAQRVVLIVSIFLFDPTISTILLTAAYVIGTQVHQSFSVSHVHNTLKNYDIKMKNQKGLSLPLKI